MSEKIAFLISPIGKEGSDIRKRADKVQEYLIDATLNPLGYSVLRADAIERPGIITTQIVDHLMNDPLVVADLTGHNPNVFYELAVRHAVQKPVIKVAEQGEEIPFDIAAMRVIPFRMDDIPMFEDAKNQIIAQAKEIEKDSKAGTDSPIRSAILYDTINKAEKGGEIFGEISEALREIRSGISSLSTRLSDPTLILPPEYFLRLVDRDRSIAEHPALHELLRIAALVANRGISTDPTTERMLGDLGDLARILLDNRDRNPLPKYVIKDEARIRRRVPPPPPPPDTNDDPREDDPGF